MKLTKDGYYINRHSCFLLQYHLVLVTKYRHPVLVGKLRNYLLEYTQEYFDKQGCRIIEIQTCEDHIHILFEAPPQINMADFVNAYKSASSRRVRKLFPEFLTPYYWKPYFWSLSYFLGTVSERTTTVVANYIRNQQNQQRPFTPV